MTDLRRAAAERFAIARIEDGADLRFSPGSRPHTIVNEPRGISMLVRVLVTNEQIDAQLEVDAQARAEGGAR